MKAIIIAGPGDARMIEVKKPVVGPMDALVKVSYSGICGTDLAIFSGEMGLVKEGLIKYPVRIGHEWSGIIEEVGSEVKAFKPGDRVVSDSGVTCGQCEHCLEGDYGCCEHSWSVGTINCWDGSFAEYMLMPDRHLFKLPEGISLDEAALIEPASIALAGLKQSNVDYGSTILIIGTGPVGLSAVPMAKAMGAKKVIISGRKPYKLDVAKKVGADTVVNVICEDLKEIVAKETGGKGVDIVIETSGNIVTLNQSVELVKMKGIIALIGFYETNLNDFNIDAFVMKSVDMKGIMGEYGMPQKVIDLMIQRGVSLKPLITHRFKFDEAINAIKTAGERNDTKVKMLVEMD